MMHQPHAQTKREIEIDIMFVELTTTTRTCAIMNWNLMNLHKHTTPILNNDSSNHTF